MNNPKISVFLDERSRTTLHRIAAIMYFLTITTLVVDILYRQIALGQTYRDFHDLAIIMTINVLVYLIAILYLGVFNFKKLHLPVMALIYVVLLILSSLLGLILDRFTTLHEYLSYLFRSGSVALILLGLYALAAYTGQKRLSHLSE